MSRIIGNRTGKSALDEMMEVSRQFNEECSEEERRKSDKNKAINKAPSEPVIIPEGSRSRAEYLGVEFEALAPMQNTRDLDKTIIIPEKIGFTYHKSLERLRATGYERHASPAEAFSLLADNLEGKLKRKLIETAEDMLKNNGEWLSMAFERKDDLLIVYLHPEGIVWDKGKYEKQSSFKYGAEMKFDITGKKSNTWIPLQEMGYSFSFIVYSRDFNDLPIAIKEGDTSAHIALSANGRFYPIGRALYSLSYKFNIDGTGKWASRGVKEKRP